MKPPQRNTIIMWSVNVFAEVFVAVRFLWGCTSIIGEEARRAVLNFLLLYEASAVVQMCT